MSDPTSLFDPLNDALSFLSDPSTIHWQALFFGEWVYGVFDSEYPINYPISAVMVSLASLNIIAMAGVMIVVCMNGGKALLSGLITASLSNGSSKYLIVRVILAVGLLLPTDAGVEALDAYNVNISNVQANTMRLILAGGAVADWGWQLSGKAMFDFNIGGAPTLRNTIDRSNDFAVGFVCNLMYHKTIGTINGESLFNYMVGSKGSTTSRADFKAASSLSEISLPPPSGVHQYLSILLGGQNAKCGVIEFSIIPDPDLVTGASEGQNDGIQFGQLIEEVPKMQSIMRATANSMIFGSLLPYETFAEHYYRDFASFTVETIYDVLGKTGADRFIPTEINIGSLQSAQTTLPLKVNATADAMIYLAQKLAYDQQAVSNAALSSFGNEMIQGQGSTASESYGSISERVFNRYLSGYVSAGAFWSFYQEFAGLSYEAERYTNELKIDLNDLSDGSNLCVNSTFSWFTSKELDGREYACETVGHLTLGFDFMTTIMADKGSLKQMSTTINGIDRSYGVDVNIWSNFFKTNQPSNEVELGFFAGLFVGLFESLWKGMSIIDFGNDGTAMGSGSGSRGSLLSGSDAMLLNLSGQNSPYVMLTQFGEGIRDIAFLVHVTRSALKAASDATVQVASKVNQSVLNKMPLLAPLVFLEKMFINLGAEMVSWSISVLSKLIMALTSVSLILIYALPAIPVFGWTMIILAMLFTCFAAMASVPFAAILMALPKGDGVLAPDTERFLSLLYGVFIRQPMTVVGFVGSIAFGYVGMSLFNLIWFTSMFNKIGGLSTLDSISFVIFCILGYGVGLFFICLYCFRITTLLNDASGVWFSSVLAGGAFGNSDADTQAATQGMKSLSSQLDDLAGKFMDTGNDDKPKKKGKSKDKDTSNFNA
ncbi:hypothetical protein [Vibrio sp. R78045]|uniref:hypothetical protein n=1 Tax=Vibrio sp. R78045 TaxID=3093868 RepID=UPI0036F1DFD6